MDDVYLEESSGLKENAIVSTFAPQRSKQTRDNGFRINSNLSERAIVSRRSRSRSVVSDYAKLWEQAAHGITPGYIQAMRAE